MIWLLLSILCSTFIFVIFKLFTRFKVDNLLAIVMNYITAYTVGGIDHGFEVAPWQVPEYRWFSNVVVLGFLFITLFQIMAFVSQKIGVSVVSVAVKMSLIIPVLFGFYYYGETVTPTKVMGIILALPAVYLATWKREKVKKGLAYAWLPLLLFVGSGFLDAFLKFNQHEIVPAEEHSLFASSIFGMAALIGFVFIGVRHLQAKVHWHWRSLLGGVALGIPNYGSIYFLLKALEYRGLESSVVFPVNNVGIVALSVLIGFFGFREHLSFRNVMGILLALVAILLVASENLF